MDGETFDAGTRINIELGTPMFIEIEGIEGKLKSKLIGMEPGSYLVINMPHGPPGARGKFYSGNRVTLRYVHQGSVFGFDTSILGTVQGPANLLLIAYPRLVAEHSLRKTERFDCYIPCHIESSGVSGDGTIMDISLNGCRCIMPMPGGEMRQLPAVGAEVQFGIGLPETETLALTGNVVNAIEYHSAARVGVVFGGLDEAARKQLEQVIMSFAMG